MCLVQTDAPVSSVICLIYRHRPSLIVRARQYFLYAADAFQVVNFSAGCGDGCPFACAWPGHGHNIGQRIADTPAIPRYVQIVASQRHLPDARSSSARPAQSQAVDKRISRKMAIRSPCGASWLASSMDDCFGLYVILLSCLFLCSIISAGIRSVFPLLFSVWDYLSQHGNYRKSYFTYISIVSYDKWCYAGVIILIYRRKHNGSFKCGSDNQ